MYPYLLQEVVIYLTKYMQYPPFIYLIQVYLSFTLTKYMQNSTFIYLLQV